jgi:hypothetical protein
MRQDDELVHIEDTLHSESLDFETEQSLIVVVQEKKCSGCGVVKPIGAFSQQKGAKTGRRSRCKECCKEHEKLAYQSRIRTPEMVTVQEQKCSTCGVVKPIDAFAIQQDPRRKIQRKSRCKECERLARQSATPEQRKKWNKKWRENMTPEQEEEWREKGRERFRITYHKTGKYRQYNLTKEEYEQMVRDQRGLCAICGDSSDQGTRLVIDHDHISGVVRSLLCIRCNVGIGSFKEDISRLEGAIAYLQRFA